MTEKQELSKDKEQKTTPNNTESFSKDTHVPTWKEFKKMIEEDKKLTMEELADKYGVGMEDE